MLKLYELNTEIREAQELLEEWAAEHDGDFTDFPLTDTLERVQMDRVSKLLAIACLVKDYEAEEDALASERKRLGAREKAAANKAEGLRAYLTMNMKAGEKVQDARAVISWRKSKAVIVDNLEALPGCYVFTKHEPMKSVIKEAIEAGENIPGVHLEQRESLQIK